MIWETFVAEARVSQMLLLLPVRVETYSLQNGWDFSKPKIRGEFLAKQKREEPDEVFAAPPCDPYCVLQEINKEFGTSFKVTDFPGR